MEVRSALSAVSVEESVKEVGAPQPLSPRHLYRQLRSLLWSRSQPLEENLEPLLQHPFISSFQPAQAIARLIAKERSLKPHLFENGSALSETGLAWPAGKVPHLPELAQLALLWLVVGESEAAKTLIRQLLPFFSRVSFSSLWSRENEYDCKEWLLSSALLFHAIGRKEEAAFRFQQAKGPVDPFFFFLAERLPQIEEPLFSEKIHEDPLLGAWICAQDETQGEKGTLSAAFTWTGQGTSLGAISLEGAELEIKAFGPQALPLNLEGRFGIEKIPDGNPADKWMRCFAYPEIWLSLQPAFYGSSCQLAFRFQGLAPTAPLALVFYAKAEGCKAGNEILKPKSLRRYAGEGNSLVLQQGERILRIESETSRKIQVIPLAGAGAFWNADFLISFEIHPVETAAMFSISSE